MDGNLARTSVPAGFHILTQMLRLVQCVFNDILMLMTTIHVHSPYLDDIPLEEALARWWAALAEIGLAGPFAGETVPLAESHGRITAEPVWARISSPHYHASAMDGYAVRAEDTRGASETQPLALAVGRQAFYVDTGDPLPPGINAVIMVEEVQVRQGEGGPAIEILAAVAPWQHVRPMGEDMVATELVLPANHRLRPQDIGAAAGSGHHALNVRRRPRVAIQPTGTELVAPGAELHPGDIIEYNSLVLAAMVEEWGGQPERLPPLADNYTAIRDRVAALAATHDLVLVNAGSSAGSEDFTARVVAELGQLLVHGIAIRPGHPVILGMVRVAAAATGSERQVPVIGIPGYPVSAAMTCELLVKPTIAAWLGRGPDPRPTLDAILTRKVASPEGEEEFMRVTVGQVGDRVVATPLPRGAGVLMSMVRADGLVRIPRHEAGFEAGAAVTVELFRSPEAIRHTAVAIGSHDLTLDILAEELSRCYPGRSLSSANVGSLGGLLALQRCEAHLAGSHLLDEETGEYNVPYVRRILPHTPVVLLGFVQREQGLIVPRGNPKGILSLADLTRPDVAFINRQRGAGTRVLLDYRLRQQGLDPRAIQGYEHQEYTHLAVAAAVASGAADCGMGILAAARALDLDFVSLDMERYDLVIPAQFYDSPVLAPLLAIIRDPEFAARVVGLGGYGVGDMGKVLGVVGGTG
jgi:putative molybdopterin biosynthesis protein